MSPLLVLVATAALGIEVGWQPLPEGGHEYTIQFEPELLDLLKQGKQDLISEVPPAVEIRRYRLTVGRGKLVRDVGQRQAEAALPAVNSPAAAPITQPAEEPPLAERYAEQPDQFSASDPESHSPNDSPPVEPSLGNLDSPVQNEHAAEPPDFDAAPDEPLAGPGAEPADHDPNDWDQTPLSEQLKESKSPTAWPERPEEEGSAALPVTPATLPQSDVKPQKIQQAGFAESQATKVETEKPQLTGTVAAPKPWMPFLTALVFLCCSLGANVYLGWIAWDARARYRSTLSKLRGAATGELLAS